ncbi:hypothetical protein P171DRAFT_497521 [Karstenula rhodostoma CBS 690.94]|uniref:Uncharacterized protein n=1 Tax=Karstenula rhodostoma CBS 690.94 TaxID=1392251 RepID=A0A9P4U9W5_9PLEO|nr:hypothetical protein P171DRAFT_497521 [Karstenula rhodostoma CBS 690.94]
MLASQRPFKFCLCPHCTVFDRLSTTDRKTTQRWLCPIVKVALLHCNPQEAVGAKEGLQVVPGVQKYNSHHHPNSTITTTMTPPGIRANTPKTFFFSPFSGTQYSPPSAPGPRHTHYPVVRSRTRPHVGSKRDVRAIYPATHPLCQPPVKPAAQAPTTEPSINDYFVKATIPDDDVFLKPLWKKETMERGGREVWVLAKAKGTDTCTPSTLPEVEAESSSTPFPSLFQLTSTLLLFVLTFLSSSLTTVPLSTAFTFTIIAQFLAAILNYVFLCAAYVLFPLTLWARDDGDR